MTRRAQFLAKTLLARMRHLETVLREDGPADLGEQRMRRQELVAKVLASEGVTTEWGEVLSVANAMPRVSAESDSTENDIRELAQFLERSLPL